MASRSKQMRKRQSQAILAAEPAGSLLCAAETVTVTPAVEAAEGQTPRRPSFSILAYTGGLLRVGWSRPVLLDLSGLRAGRTTVLLEHNPSQIVGQGQAAIADGKITVTGEITGDVSAGTPAASVVSHARNGFVWAASVGIAPERIEPVDANQVVTVNGRQFNGPIYIVRAGRLGEVSFVGVGADESATAAVSAANKGVSPMSFSEWLNAKNLTETALTAAERESLHAQYRAEHPAPGNPPAGQPAVPPGATPAGQPLQAAGAPFSRIDAEIAEGRRRQAIEEMAVGAIQRSNRDPHIAATVRDLATRAVEAGMSVRDFDLELLRAARPMQPPHGDSRQGMVANEQMLTAAALLAAGRGDDQVVNLCGEAHVAAAQRTFGRDIGLQEIILAAAAANGYAGRQRVTVSNWREVWQYATLPRSIQAAGLSSVDLSGILGAVANKALASVAAEPEWLAPRIAGVASHSNFHAHRIYSLALNGELQEVAPSGELKHLDMSEEYYTRQVGTRGAVLRLSRQDIINDDLSAFDRNATTLARKAFTTREKALFALINSSAAGASHFTAARGNYATGNTTFNGTAMAAAIKAFRNLAGPDGDPIMVEPAIVLVGPSNEEPAFQLLAPSSTLIVTGLAATNAKSVQSGANIYAGRFGGKPLVSPYLELASLTGYSATAWYLLADPRKYPCYEIAYLNGQQTPTVEYFGLEAEVDTLGVAWRCYWDFGVAAAEWRAGVKSGYA